LPTLRAYRVVKIDQHSTYYPELAMADLARLKTIFLSGVYDWSKHGLGNTSVVPWASFGPAPKNLVFDVTKSR
jgi:hypothetical protein